MSTRGLRSATVLAVSFVFFVALFALALVGCNNTQGDGYGYYPHDTTHGHYDVHHHYHYYPQYGSGRYKVKPAPRKHGGSIFRKSGGFKSGGGSRRR